MIVVQAVLVPHGDPDSPRKESLGYVEIVNDGTGTDTRRNYEVRLYSRGDKPRLVKKVRIEGWPSKAKSAFKLVIEAMKKLDEA